MVLAVALALSGCGHPGDHANGTVFKKLNQTTMAIPTGAAGKTVRSMNSTWIDGCPELSAAHSGWSPVQGYISFDAASSVNVIDQVDFRLRHLGWQRHDVVITRGQGPVAHWSLSVPNGRKADAFAFQAPPKSGHWALNSTWQPPGPTGEGCP